MLTNENVDKMIQHILVGHERVLVRPKSCKQNKGRIKTYSWSTWSGILKNLITFEKYIQLLNYYAYLVLNMKNE